MKNYEDLDEENGVEDAPDLEMVDVQDVLSDQLTPAEREMGRFVDMVLPDEQKRKDNVMNMLREIVKDMPPSVREKTSNMQLFTIYFEVSSALAKDRCEWLGIDPLKYSF